MNWWQYAKSNNNIITSARQEIDLAGVDDAILNAYNKCIPYLEGIYRNLNIQEARQELNTAAKILTKEATIAVHNLGKFKNTPTIMFVSPDNHDLIFKGDLAKAAAMHHPIHNTIYLSANRWVGSLDISAVRHELSHLVEHEQSPTSNLNNETQQFYKKFQKNTKELAANNPEKYFNMRTEALAYLQMAITELDSLYPDGPGSKINNKAFMYFVKSSKTIKDYWSNPYVWDSTKKFMLESLYNHYFNARSTSNFKNVHYDNQPSPDIRLEPINVSNVCGMIEKYNEIGLNNLSENDRQKYGVLCSDILLEISKKSTPTSAYPMYDQYEQLRKQGVQNMSPMEKSNFFNLCEQIVSAIRRVAPAQKPQTNQRQQENSSQNREQTNTGADEQKVNLPPNFERHVAQPGIPLTPEQITENRQWMKNKNITH